jgi:hypothetical protein
MSAGPPATLDPLHGAFLSPGARGGSRSAGRHPPFGLPGPTDARRETPKFHGESAWDARRPLGRARPRLGRRTCISLPHARVVRRRAGCRGRDRQRGGRTRGAGRGCGLPTGRAFARRSSRARRCAHRPLPVPAALLCAAGLRGYQSLPTAAAVAGCHSVDARAQGAGGDGRGSGRNEVGLGGGRARAHGHVRSNRARMAITPGRRARDMARRRRGTRRRGIPRVDLGGS